MTIKVPKILTPTAIDLPSSKSISNRVLIINALAKNNSLPHNLSDCDDTNAVLQWMKNKPEVIDIGAAGTAMRFSTALLAMTEGTHVITGSERMKQRPIAILVEALRTLGADISYLEKEGFPPLKIIGNTDMKGGSLALDGSVSSQFISALLMIAPYMLKGLKLALKNNVISLPYINMTLSIMRYFGADAEWTSENEITVKHGQYKPCDYRIENDWSAASYWYEIMALSESMNSLTLQGLTEKSLQGDSKVVQIFENLGIHTRFEIHDNISAAILTKTNKIVNSFCYDFSGQPDIAQTLVVTCCMMNIPFTFSGLSTLKIKETDRIAALIKEMDKLGFSLQETGSDSLSWDGSHRNITSKELQHIAIDTYKDHRMAMAFAPAAIKTRSLIINDPLVVTKSYTSFWNDLKKIGFIIDNPVP